MITKKRGLPLLAGLGLLLAAFYTSAATTTAGLQLNNFSQGAEGVFISFKTMPPGCSTSYKGFHALVPNTTNALNTIVAILAQRRVTGETLTVVYDAAGSCDQPSTLLRVVEVK